MKTKNKMKGEFENTITVSGTITSKIRHSVKLNNEVYSFRLSCQVNRDNYISFNIKCDDYEIIKILLFNDKVKIQGYFVDELYKGSDEYKILRTIYSNVIKKIVI